MIMFLITNHSLTCGIKGLLPLMIMSLSLYLNIAKNQALHPPPTFLYKVSLRPGMVQYTGITNETVTATTPSSGTLEKIRIFI